MVLDGGSESADPGPRLNAVSGNGQFVSCCDRRPQGRDRAARAGMAKAEWQETEAAEDPLTDRLSKEKARIFSSKESIRLFTGL